MKTYLIAISLLMAASTTQARLGETIEQCRTRYGDPKQIEINDELAGVATYTKNDLAIAIHFTNGKADLIRYSSGLVSKVDFELAKYLLQLNGRNKEWDQLTKTTIVLQEILDQNMQHPRTELVDPVLWKSKDGILAASYSESRGVFEVKSAVYQDKIRQGL